MTLAPVAAPPARVRLVEPPLPLRAARLLVLLAVALPALLQVGGLDRWLVRLLPLAAAALLLAVPVRSRLQLRVPWTVLLLLAWCAASAAWTADPGNTVRRLVDLGGYAAAGLLAGQLLGLAAAREAVARAAQVVLTAVAVSLVVAPGWATRPGPDNAPGWHGMLSHKNSLGFFCVVALASLWLQLPPGRARRCWIALAVVLLVGSQSSSALAAGLVVAGVVLWTRARGRLRRATSRAAASTLLALGLGVAVVAGARNPDVVLGLLGRNSSLTGRTEIWGAVWRQVKAEPWLGHGWGGLWQPESAPTRALWREARFEAFYAHNGYLDVLAQIGVVGAALVLAVVLGALGRAWRRRTDDGHLWAAVIVVVLLVWSLTESAPFTGEGLLLLFLVAGAARTRLSPPAPAAAPSGPTGAGRPAARTR